jgi:N-acetylmuramoyl-L-alanine amidase
MKGDFKLYRFITTSFLIGLLFVLVNVLSVNAADLDGVPKRIDGNDRFEVATNISKNWDHADYVVVTNYLAFADALTAAPFAYKMDAPILLSHPTSLTPETKDEINRLKAKKVYVIGGTGSITDHVMEELKDNGRRVVERIGGKDRFEVALNLAQRLGLKDKAIIANGFVFPDALTIAPYASANGIPILLTNNTNLPANIHDFLKKSAVTKTWIIGGEGSVSRAVATGLPSPTRIGGKDRYEVASNVAKTFGQDNKRYFLATGMSFADALTGSILAAKEGGNILLTYNQELPQDTLQLLKQNNRPVTILGGTGSVGDEIVGTIMDLHPSARPIIYFVPHQDDEILSLGIDIRNELSRGRNVQLVLMTDGENSGARDILNGQYDSESNLPSLAGEKVYCSWHHIYHDPVKENFQLQHLTFEQFSNLRTDEFKRALTALGVPEEQIHIEGLHVDNINIDNVERIINKYVALYPNADVRSLSWFDGHPTHSLIGQTIRSLQTTGVLERYQAKYFISVYTDRFYPVEKPIKTQMELMEKSPDLSFLTAAANEYKRFDPQNGYYAIGYHSVDGQFDALMTDPYTEFHY